MKGPRLVHVDHAEGKGLPGRRARREVARAAAGPRSRDRQAAQGRRRRTRTTRRCSARDSSELMARATGRGRASPPRCRAARGRRSFAKAHPDALLRRRHRRGARGHVRRRPRDARDPAGRRDLLDVPPARVRQHHPRRRDPAAARDLLHGSRGSRGRGRRDAHGAVRHRVHARGAEHDGHGAEGRPRDARPAARGGRAHERAVRAALSARRGARLAAGDGRRSRRCRTARGKCCGRARRRTSRSSPSARWCCRRSRPPRRSRPKGSRSRS